MMVHPQRPAVKRAKVAEMDRFGYCRKAKCDESDNRRDVNRPIDKIRWSHSARLHSNGLE